LQAILEKYENEKCYKYEDHLEHIDWVVGPPRRTDTRGSHIEGKTHQLNPVIQEVCQVVDIE
jgi:hypothetical protein